MFGSGFPFCWRAFVYLGEVGSALLLLLVMMLVVVFLVVKVKLVVLDWAGQGLLDLFDLLLLLLVLRLPRVVVPAAALE